MKCLGIDPGKTNLGWAVLEKPDESEGSIQLLGRGYLDPSKKGLFETVEFFRDLGSSSHRIIIERYVAYEGVHNSASEDILMLIGALTYALGPSKVSHPRAADWKVFMAKRSFKLGFRNPSESFDKKYSIALAEFITGVKPETDHEADAIGLAAYGLLS